MSSPHGNLTPAARFWRTAELRDSTFRHLDTNRQRFRLITLNRQAFGSFVKAAYHDIHFESYIRNFPKLEYAPFDRLQQYKSAVEYLDITGITPKLHRFPDIFTFFEIFPCLHRLRWTGGSLTATRSSPSADPSFDHRKDIMRHYNRDGLEKGLTDVGDIIFPSLRWPVSHLDSITFQMSKSELVDSFRSTDQVYLSRFCLSNALLSGSSDTSILITEADSFPLFGRPSDLRTAGLQHHFAYILTSLAVIIRGDWQSPLDCISARLPPCLDLWVGLCISLKALLAGPLLPLGRHTRDLHVAVSLDSLRPDVCSNTSYSSREGPGIHASAHRGRLLKRGCLNHFTLNILMKAHITSIASLLVSPDLPAISSIAQFLLATGGAGCTYVVQVFDRDMSDTLTTVIRREIEAILEAERKQQGPRWRKLLVAERMKDEIGEKQECCDSPVKMDQSE